MTIARSVPIHSNTEQKVNLRLFGFTTVKLHSYTPNESVPKYIHYILQGDLVAVAYILATNLYHVFHWNSRA